MNEKELTNLLFDGIDDINKLEYKHISKPIGTNILKLEDKEGNWFIITINKYS